jgi:hypothetical protein
LLESTERVKFPGGPGGYGCSEPVVGPNWLVIGSLTKVPLRTTDPLGI